MYSREMDWEVVRVEEGVNGSGLVMVVSVGVMDSVMYLVRGPW